MIRDYKDLQVYQRAETLAMDIFHLIASFPKHERYSLTDPIVRSARSVCANIVEGWAKRTYENVFKRHLVDAYGEAKETQMWLDFALKCGYVETTKHQELANEIEVICKMVWKLHANWKS